MIRECAQITVKPGEEEAFLAAVEKAVPIFRDAKGCRSMKLERVIEAPGTFRLMVLWETLDNHIVDFRESQGFQDWRALVGPHFAAPPAVDHGEVVVHGF